MNGVENSQLNIIKGLTISGLSHFNQQIILPHAYCKDILSVDHDEILSSSEVQKHMYLKRIHNQIPDLDRSIPISLIIGGICKAAVEPLEVIPSQGNGPFAMKTRLGWCLAGAVRYSPPSIGSTCNNIRIKAYNILTKQPSNHMFVIRSQCKDASISDKLNEMYINDFNEKLQLYKT